MFKKDPELAGISKFLAGFIVALALMWFFMAKIEQRALIDACSHDISPTACLGSVLD